MRISLGRLRCLIREAAGDVSSVLAEWFQRHDDILSAFEDWRFPQGHRSMSYEEVRQLDDPADLQYVLGIKLRDMKRDRDQAASSGEDVDAYDGYIEGLVAALSDLKATLEQRRQSQDW